jgi:hypothetical protein
VNGYLCREARKAAVSAAAETGAFARWNPASTCGTCRSRPGRAFPRTTMRYDRARKNLDRHPNYILAAYMASGT